MSIGTLVGPCRSIYGGYVWIIVGIPIVFPVSENHSSLLTPPVRIKPPPTPPHPLTCNIFIVVDYSIPGVFDIWEVGVFNIGWKG